MYDLAATVEVYSFVSEFSKLEVIMVFIQVVKQIQSDVLSVLDGYARLLYQANPNWHRQISKRDLYRMDFETPLTWANKELPSWNSTL